MGIVTPIPPPEFRNNVQADDFNTFTADMMSKGILTVHDVAHYRDVLMLAFLAGCDSCADDAAGEINSAQRVIDDLKTQISTLEGEVNDLEGEVGDLEEQNEVLAAELANERRNLGEDE